MPEEDTFSVEDVEMIVNRDDGAQSEVLCEVVAITIDVEDTQRGALCGVVACT
jgi:hypothetical protein